MVLERWVKFTLKINFMQSLSSLSTDTEGKGELFYLTLFKPP